MIALDCVLEQSPFPLALQSVIKASTASETCVVSRSATICLYSTLDQCLLVSRRYRVQHLRCPTKGDLPLLKPENLGIPSQSCQETVVGMIDSGRPVGVVMVFEPYEGILGGQRSEGGALYRLLVLLVVACKRVSGKQLIEVSALSSNGQIHSLMQPCPSRYE
jgi:hypothetical protein